MLVPTSRITRNEVDVDASLRLQPQGGRFLEMGKTDIRDPAVVAAQHPGVAYRAFDLVDAGPERIQQMLSELMALFERGVLRPPPVTTWDVRRAPEAFRALAQARLVGKVVLMGQAFPQIPQFASLVDTSTQLTTSESWLSQAASPSVAHCGLKLSSYPNVGSPGLLGMPPS